ncbi:MAG: TIM barrel protein [Firmicutes bacterium]|nr:TIM barrel protein [Bacillota bacterium]
MIKIGCQTVAFVPQLTDFLDEVLEKIAAMGYAGVEIGARFIKTPARFSKITSELGLEIAGLHYGANLWDEAGFEQSRADFEQVARLAERLSCPRIVLSGVGPQDRSLDREDLGVQVDGLNQLGEIAKKHGAKVYYHNHAWEFQDDERVIQSIVRGTAREVVGLALDLGWAEYAGSDPIKTIERYRDRIGHLHIRDLRGSTFVELGNGSTDVHTIIQQLQKMNYSDWLVVEMEPHALSYGGKLSPAESIAMGYGFLKALLYHG